ncbi:MAG: hypothetical protein Q8O84_05560 [Nanoarchaeota archaeon]|nr:hypothetical protein [Nanoarchaeota archaeon]
MKKINLSKNRVKKNSRHIRWNWQKSPDSEEMIRCHFIVVDDKNRNGKMEKILDGALNKSIIQCMFDEIRSVEGKVEGSKFKYLFKTYDTAYTPAYLNPKTIFPFVIRDKELYERQKDFEGIVKYVAKIYDD